MPIHIVYIHLSHKYFHRSIVDIIYRFLVSYLAMHIMAQSSTHYIDCADTFSLIRISPIYIYIYPLYFTKTPSCRCQHDLTSKNKLMFSTGAHKNYNEPVFCFQLLITDSSPINRDATTRALPKKTVPKNNFKTDRNSGQYHS